MSEPSEQARVDMANMPERESPGDKPAQTRATATDEQRARVSEWQIDLSHAGQACEAKAIAAVVADSEALAARDAGVADEFDLRRAPICPDCDQPEPVCYCEENAAQNERMQSAYDHGYDAGSEANR